MGHDGPGRRIRGFPCGRSATGQPRPCRQQWRAAGGHPESFRPRGEIAATIPGEPAFLNRGERNSGHCCPAAATCPAIGHLRGALRHVCRRNRHWRSVVSSSGNYMFCSRSDLRESSKNARSIGAAFAITRTQKEIHGHSSLSDLPSSRKDRPESTSIQSVDRQVSRVSRCCARNSSTGSIAGTVPRWGVPGERLCFRSAIPAPVMH